MRDPLQLRVRGVDGVGGSASLTAPLLALLGQEVALARPLGCVDAVAAAKTHNLLTRALGRRFDMPTSLMGTDEVVSALCADPLAIGGVVLETIEV